MLVHTDNKMANVALNMFKLILSIMESLKLEELIVNQYLQMNKNIEELLVHINVLKKNK